MYSKISFNSVLLVVLVTFLLASIVLYRSARKTSAEAAAFCALYDLTWVLLSFGALLLLYLTAGSQILRGLEFDANIQRDYESSAYRDLLLKVPLTNVCIEPLAVKPGETLESASGARDEACLWAKESTSMARKLKLQQKEVDSSCANDADLKTLRFPLSPSSFPVCSLSQANSCARAICEQDKTVRMIDSQRVIKPMPTGFNSDVFREFNDKLNWSTPKVKLDRTTYQAYKPIETGVFAMMWVWAFAIGFGLRLAKAWFEVHTRLKEAAEKSDVSYFRIQPTNWKPWKK